MRPEKPAATVKRAKTLRRALSLPEVLLWQQLRTAPGGHKFRKQHPAGPYVLDFFCARANLAIEIDGIVHDMGDGPAHDARRGAWLAARQVGTLRITARDVLTDLGSVVEGIVAAVDERSALLGKIVTPPSAVPAATSPLQVNGEDLEGGA